MTLPEHRRPADTTMMRIVHDALRRDLRRARECLSRTPAPGPRQRAAIAEQLRWMMAFLDAHHRSEDEGLYPLLRERDPSAAALLDELHEEHERVAAAADELCRAADAARQEHGAAALVASVEQLAASLLPHLDREESLAMPLVAAAITAEEWRDIEQRFNLDGKSIVQLGREGHWLIDDADPEDRATVLHLVPPPARVLLLHGFGPSYRRRKRACWTPERRIAHAGGAAVEVDAGIGAVWDIVRDPTRVGEWSHECVDGTWLDGATSAGPGARFRGRNRHGPFRWGRRCEVLHVAPYRLTWRTIPTLLYPDSTEWTIELSAVGAGNGTRTRIEQRFRVVKGTALEPLYAMLITSHRDRTDALAGDLRRIGQLAGRAGTARSVAS